MVRLISFPAALGRELDHPLFNSSDLPDLIARVLARLDLPRKTNPPHGVIDRQSGEGVADSVINNRI